MLNDQGRLYESLSPVTWLDKRLIAALTSTWNRGHCRHWLSQVRCFYPYCSFKQHVLSVLFVCSLGIKPTTVHSPPYVFSILCTSMQPSQGLQSKNERRICKNTEHRWAPVLRGPHALSLTYECVLFTLKHSSRLLKRYDNIIYSNRSSFQPDCWLFQNYLLVLLADIKCAGSNHLPY